MEGYFSLAEQFHTQQDPACAFPRLLCMRALMRMQIAAWQLCPCASMPSRLVRAVLTGVHLMLFSTRPAAHLEGAVALVRRRHARLLYAH